MIKGKRLQRPELTTNLSGSGRYSSTEHSGANSIRDRKLYTITIGRMILSYGGSLFLIEIISEFIIRFLFLSFCI